MVNDHREDLQAFRKEASTGASPEVRDAARKGAVIVQHHLEMAEQIAKNHNVDIASK
jgi:putative membrane protein